MLLMIGLLGLLSSCSLLAPEICPDRSIESRQLSLAQMHDWRLRGRLIVPAKEGGRMRLNFLWQQKGRFFRIILAGPLGFSAVSLSRDAQGFRLRRPGKPDIVRRDADALMRQFFGWSLPLTHVAYWLKGQILSGDQVMWGKNNAPKRVIYGPWRVHWSAYRCIQGQLLPDHMIFRAKKRLIQLDVDAWTIAKEDDE